MSLRAAIVTVVVACGLASPATAEPLGKKPGYSNRAPTTFANATAITRQIWVPGLDEGYVPQGLTVVEGALFVSAYKSEDTKQNTGPCRLYRLDPASGAMTGTLDLPPACGHAGGLARGPKGQIYVVDTHTVFAVAVASPPVATIGRIVGTTKLTGALKGSFAAGGADALWLGAYERGEGARLFKVPFAKLSGVIDERAATENIGLPTLAQGAAFDRAGRLWITRSGSKFGELLEIAPLTGAVVATYTMPAGIEDLSFDADGGLWTLSEAGSKRWSGWTEHFPIVFRLDVAKLRK